MVGKPYMDLYMSDIYTYIHIYIYTYILMNYEAI